MRRLVLDASAALRVVLRQEGAGELVRHIGEARLVLAPEVYVSEVANGLWKYVNSGQLDLDEAQARLEEALQLVDLLVAGVELVTEALAAAAKHRHPVYDLLYAVLARRHGCGVVTADRRLAGLAADFGLPRAGEG